MPDVPAAATDAPALLRLAASGLRAGLQRRLLDSHGTAAAALAAGPRDWASHGVPAETVRDLPRVSAHNLALGRSSGTAEMTDLAQSVQNRIITEPGAEGRPTQTVQIQRGADFCQANGIKRISYLKIDTEGHDLDVLRGFTGMFKRIDFVQVEAGMNPHNKTHVPYAQLSDFLTRRGFCLFYIFDQVMEFKQGGRPVLRRCNPVFIIARLVDLTGIA